MTNDTIRSGDSSNPTMRGTARVVLPASLRNEQVEQYRVQFYREFNPVTVTERVIVNDLARRAANLELLEQVTGSLQRQGARALLEVTLPLADEGSDAEDAVLAGAVASGRMDECHRQSLGNARAMYRALDALLEIQQQRRDNTADDLARPDPRFATEPCCMSYLLRRFEFGQQRCRRCGKAEGCWISGRRCWECAHCKAQTGLRVGTVMEKSALPLVKWFLAIRHVLLQPNCTTADLSAHLDIKRAATVRLMAAKIRQAMNSETAGKLLAGLDEAFLPTT